jgi:hypothetical protein
MFERLPISHGSSVLLLRKLDLDDKREKMLKNTKNNILLGTGSNHNCYPILFLNYGVRTHEQESFSVSRPFPLERIEQAYRTLKRGQCL